MRRGMRIELKEVSELSHRHKNSANLAVSFFFLLIVQ